MNTVKNTSLSLSRMYSGRRVAHVYKCSMLRNSTRRRFDGKVGHVLLSVTRAVLSDPSRSTWLCCRPESPRLEVHGSMALGFVDLEKAFDTVPREMVMATLRWMGVPEAEVRMVEGTYEKTTARVVVGEGASEEFEVKIGLR